MSNHDNEARSKELMDPGAGFSIDPSTVQSSLIGPADKKEDDKSYEEKKDVVGKTVWIDKPTFEDQYKRFPETTRLVGPSVAVFNVAEPAQLADLNALLAKQQPEAAPSILIASRKENFFEGKWLMLLEYFRVEYKQLISTS
jgi:hypothetical protein